VPISSDLKSEASGAATGAGAAPPLGAGGESSARPGSDANNSAARTLAMRAQVTIGRLLRTRC